MTTNNKADISLSLVKPELYTTEYANIKKTCQNRDKDFIDLANKILAHARQQANKPPPISALPIGPIKTSPPPKSPPKITPMPVSKKKSATFGCLSAFVRLAKSAFKQKQIREDQWDDISTSFENCIKQLPAISSTAIFNKKIFTFSSEVDSEEDDNQSVTLDEIAKKIDTLEKAYSSTQYWIDIIRKESTATTGKKALSQEALKKSRQRLIQHHFTILKYKCEILESLSGKTSKQDEKDLNKKYKKTVQDIGYIFQDKILMSGKVVKLFRPKNAEWKQKFSNLRDDYYNAAFTKPKESRVSERIRILRSELNVIELAKKILCKEEFPSEDTYKEVNKLKLDYIYLECKDIVESFEINKYENSTLIDVFDEVKPGFVESAFDSWEIRDNIRDYFSNYKSHINEILQKKGELNASLTKVKNKLHDLRNIPDNNPTEISKNETARDELTQREKDLTNQIKKLDITIYQTVLQKLIKIIKASQIHKRDFVEKVSNKKAKKSQIEKELKYISFMIDSENPKKKGQNKFRTSLRDFKKELKNELNDQHSKVIESDRTLSDLEAWKKLEESKKKEHIQLERNITIDEAHIDELEKRVEYLDLEYHDLWEKHRTLWLSVIPKKRNMKQNVIQGAKEVLTEGLSFGFIKMYEPLHPTELATKHDFAMGGYRSTVVVKNWIEEILNAPNTQKKLIDELDNFERWAEKHPFTAAKMAGDLAHTISILKQRDDAGVGESIFMPLLSSLRGRVFAYHMLVGFGSPQEEEADDQPHEFPYRALAELLAVSPELAMLKQSVGSLSNIANLLNPFTTIQTATGMVGSYVVNKISAKTVETLLNKIDVKSQHLLLRILRVGFNATIQLPYIDSVLEQERITSNAKNGKILQAALRPVKLASDIKATVKRWFLVMREAKGAEKLIRLAPVFGVSVVAAPSLLFFLGLPYLSLGTIISLAYFVFPALFVAYPKWAELLNTKYKNTIDKVKRKEAENLYLLHRRRITEQYDAYIEDYIEALQDGLSIPKFAKPELTSNLPDAKIQKYLNDPEFNNIVKRVYRTNQKVFSSQIKEMKKMAKANSELALLGDAEITEAFASSLHAEEIEDKISEKIEKHYGSDLHDDVMNYLVSEALHQVGDKLLHLLRSEFDDNFKEQVIHHLIEYGNTNKLFLKTKVNSKRHPKMILQKQIEKDLKGVEGLNLTDKERKGFGASLMSVMTSISKFNGGEVRNRMKPSASKNKKAK